MAGVGPQDLQALAQELLDAAIESLDTVPDFIPGLEGAPERAFISPGLPAFDCCPQLTVHVGTILEAPTSPPGLEAGLRARSARINHVQLVLSHIRCVPIGTGTNPPSEDELQAAAQQLNADGWALWNHIFNMIRAEQLFALCSEVFWDGLRSIVPQGGCAGWTGTFRVQLDGYEEVLGT